MELAFDDPADRGGVLGEVRVPGIDFQLQLVEEGEPFDFAEEAKRERNAMVGVSEPIHDGEGVKGEESVAGVVLEDDETAGDAEGLFEEDGGVRGVMQDIDEHDGVEGAIGEGDRRAVEMLYGDRG